MIRSSIKAYLIITLFLISATGLSVHIWVHNPLKFSFGLIPLTAGILSTFVTPLLFCFRKTLHPANLFNGITAIVGIITMTHFMTTGAPLYPDIALTLAKFFIGISIFNLCLYPDLNLKPAIKGWRLIRYPNLGFWGVHAVMLSIVYTLGHTLWR